MEIWFTSDTHFGHANVIDYCNRPFKDVDEMDTTMVLNWNYRVSSKDLVYHLGDFHFGPKSRLDEILSALRGRIILIAGNHDRKQTRRHPRFESVHDYLEINYNRKKLVLCHYPLYTWNKSHRGSYNLHGHCHGGINRKDREVEKHSRRIDVGVDTNDFKPYHVGDLIIEPTP